MEKVKEIRMSELVNQLYVETSSFTGDFYLCTTVQASNFN